MQRQVIQIDEQLCTGCAQCIPGCPEGALRVIDGKARLVSDLFCDGLGACVGHCPTGAMRVETREAGPYDERRVLAESIVPKGPNVLAAHLRHLKDHGAVEYLREALLYMQEHGIENPLHSAAPSAGGHHEGGGCPGSRPMAFGAAAPRAHGGSDAPESALRQWPVQLHLVSPEAPCYRGSDLLLAADCTAFAMGDFHTRHLPGKSLAIACPKLDSGMDVYVQKLIAMIDMGGINTITVLLMEVPCCGGLMGAVQEACRRASRWVRVKKVVVSVQGEVLGEEWVG
ncbi:ATP-binding protein [Pelodictyon luteolum]|uniref:Iron-sulfur cluster-binding protein n=1 Tax=Chlorobium luteolum (strain DSM 273 / BCRC 81028 / 2530) TaxID=319225 RepID=Q3B2A6_CHLL3|nr:4Fe-4S binding protein [Pelodictyon luteolum]ABB24525.1 iron-sulfur cluster-binding protein [Pelodictyon luteolum DSM 273]